MRVCLVESLTSAVPIAASAAPRGSSSRFCLLGPRLPSAPSLAGCALCSFCLRRTLAALKVSSGDAGRCMLARGLSAPRHPLGWTLSACFLLYGAGAFSFLRLFFFFGSCVRACVGGAADSLLCALVPCSLMVVVVGRVLLLALGSVLPVASCRGYCCLSLAPAVSRGSPLPPLTFSPNPRACTVPHCLAPRVVSSPSSPFPYHPSWALSRVRRLSPLRPRVTVPCLQSSGSAFRVGRPSALRCVVACSAPAFRLGGRLWGVSARPCLSCYRSSPPRWARSATFHSRLSVWPAVLRGCGLPLVLAAALVAGRPLVFALVLVLVRTLAGCSPPLCVPLPVVCSRLPGMFPSSASGLLFPALQHCPVAAFRARCFSVSSPFLCSEPRVALPAFRLRWPSLPRFLRVSARGLYAAHRTSRSLRVNAAVLGLGVAGPLLPHLMSAPAPPCPFWLVCRGVRPHAVFPVYSLGILVAAALCAYSPISPSYALAFPFVRFRLIDVLSHRFSFPPVSFSPCRSFHRLSFPYLLPSVNPPVQSLSFPHCALPFCVCCASCGVFAPAHCLAGPPRPSLSPSLPCSRLLLVLSFVFCFPFTFSLVPAPRLFARSQPSGSCPSLAASRVASRPTFWSVPFSSLFFGFGCFVLRSSALPRPACRPGLAHAWPPPSAPVLLPPGGGGRRLSWFFFVSALSCALASAFPAAASWYLTRVPPAFT